MQMSQYGRGEVGGGRGGGWCLHLASGRLAPLFLGNVGNVQGANFLGKWPLIDGWSTGVFASKSRRLSG